jgi:hypothetical protein
MLAISPANPLFFYSVFVHANYDYASYAEFGSFRSLLVGE